MKIIRRDIKKAESFEVPVFCGDEPENLSDVLSLDFGKRCAVFFNEIYAETIKEFDFLNVLKLESLNKMLSLKEEWLMGLRGQSELLDAKVKLMEAGLPRRIGLIQRDIVLNERGGVVEQTIRLKRLNTVAGGGLLLVEGMSILLDTNNGDINKAMEKFRRLMERMYLQLLHRTDKERWESERRLYICKHLGRSVSIGRLHLLYDDGFRESVNAPHISAIDWGLEWIKIVRKEFFNWVKETKRERWNEHLERS